MKTCPYCAEEVKEAAIKCKHCGSTIGEVTESPVSNTLVTEKPTVLDNGIGLVILGIIFAAVSVFTLTMIPLLGVFGIIIGVVMVAAGFNPTSRVDCPKCESAVTVSGANLTAKCRKCQTEYSVKWKEREKVELPY